MKIKKELVSLYSTINYLIYKTKNKFHILNDEETITEIIKNKKSISRFGDGEFKWVLGVKQNSFQSENEELTRRLKEVLMSNVENLLVCIPRSLNTLDGLIKNTKIFWKNFVRWHGNDILPYLDKKTYGNTNFTRWYLEHENKDEEVMNKKLTNLKKIWDKRDIIIVEGFDTKMGVGNDLFKNSSSIKRILVPATDAFSIYEEILEGVKKVSKDKLILLAIGPTATVLAYDLSKLGYQALDLGHLDIEYEWFLNKATTKIAIKGKHVNEVNNKKIIGSLNDKNYEKSIIAKLGERDAN